MLLIKNSEVEDSWSTWLYILISVLDVKQYAYENVPADGLCIS